MSDAFTPVPEDHFTFGLWTVGNPGRDPFGHEVRAPLDPVDSVKHLAERRARTASASTTTTSCPSARARPSATRSSPGSGARSTRPGCACRWPRATCSRSRCSSDGAFTANDVQVRRFALAKTLDAIDLGVELGAEIFVMWGGREGCEVDAAMDIRAALDRYAEAVEPRVRVRARAGLRRCGSRSSRSPTSRAATSCSRRWATCSRSSTSSSIPEMVGLNPEFAHETMSRSLVPPRGRAGAVAREALPHRPQRAASRASTTRTSASAPRASATRSTS